VGISTLPTTISILHNFYNLSTILGLGHCYFYLILDLGSGQIYFYYYYSDFVDSHVVSIRSLSIALRASGSLWPTDIAD
jgi:hypothetical protein